MNDTCDADDAAWFPSPAKAASAVAVPAFVLPEYDTVVVVDKPPAPDTVAVHGVNADPVNTTDTGHDTTVVDEALEIVNDTCDADDAAWFPSPANAASAVAVPAFVLPEYDTVVVVDNPPTPDTDAVHGVNADPVNTTEPGHDTTTTEAALEIANEPSTNEDAA